MPTAKAIVILPEGKKAGIREVPIPEVRDEWVLVKVKTVALNPTDWKHIDYGYAEPGCKIGCDYAGVVEKVGNKVTKLKEGDRILGFVHGGNKLDRESGAFGEYLIAKACVQMKIPDNLTFEQAATVAVSTITCGLGLYKSLKLPLPNNPAIEPFPILIYGGSTATGMWGIQFAKASGLTVITTASPSNFDRLRSLGADAVFDYRSPTCSRDIRQLTNNKLRHAWDCFGGGEVICGESLSSSEPSIFGAINMSSVTDTDLLRRTNPLVDGPHYISAYDHIAEPYEWKGSIMGPKLEEMEFGMMFSELTCDLLQRGTIKPIEPTVNKTGSGLEGVMKGLDEMRAGRVSGTKLVFTL